MWAPRTRVWFKRVRSAFNCEHKSVLPARSLACHVSNSATFLWDLQCGSTTLFKSSHREATLGTRVVVMLSIELARRTLPGVLGGLDQTPKDKAVVWLPGISDRGYV